jgi:hypothetical protein
MNTFEADIVNMYDEQDMSVEDIGAELNGELDPAAIKLLLSQHSHRFQKATVEAAKKGKVNGAVATTVPGAPAQNPDFLNESDKAKIRRTFMTLLDHSENDMVRARIAIYLHEEATGRNERRIKANTLPNIQLNVLALNQEIAKARELLGEKMKQVGKSPMLGRVVNVETVAA